MLFALVLHCLHENLYSKDFQLCFSAINNTCLWFVRRRDRHAWFIIFIAPNLVPKYYALLKHTSFLFAFVKAFDKCNYLSLGVSLVKGDAPSLPVNHGCHSVAFFVSIGNNPEQWYSSLTVAFGRWKLSMKTWIVLSATWTTSQALYARLEILSDATYWAKIEKPKIAKLN